MILKFVNNQLKREKYAHLRGRYTREYHELSKTKTNTHEFEIEIK